ncbi:MAG: hypothetical protein G01um101444_484 [Parcubacteria group bacterium Gr01-1014_44]|nr:MAG: hypothetical protein G01um101444_484 [Parcubacteria group bacterium Gr01-1014_44]
MKYPAFVCISLCSLQLLVILLTSFPNWRTASADFVGRRSLCRPKAEGRFGDRRRRGGVLFLRNYPCLWHKDNFSFRAGVLEKVKQFTFSRYPSPPTRPNYDKITNTFGITDFVNAVFLGLEPTACKHYKAFRGIFPEAILEPLGRIKSYKSDTKMGQLSVIVGILSSYASYATISL